MAGRIAVSSALVALLSGCWTLLPPETRPPTIVGEPGPPRPDGCAVENLLPALGPPAGLREIGTVSAVAGTRGQCEEYLVRHEACRMGADVIFGLQDGDAMLGEQVPHAWCTARIGRRVEQPSRRETSP